MDSLWQKRQKSCQKRCAWVNLCSCWKAALICRKSAALSREVTLTARPLTEGLNFKSRRFTYWCPLLCCYKIKIIIKRSNHYITEGFIIHYNKVLDLASFSLYDEQQFTNNLPVLLHYVLPFPPLYPTFHTYPTLLTSSFSLTGRDWLSFITWPVA